VYVNSLELYDYFTDRAKAYGVHDHVHLNNRVVEARWNEATGQYNLIIEDLSSGTTFTDQAEVLINSTGILK
jgi:cation diffusion facilitator CzcD-associated flavoprotein CzcO